jgi:hypothetical protein
MIGFIISALFLFYAMFCLSIVRVSIFLQRWSAILKGRKPADSLTDDLFMEELKERLVGR